jgi:hypothetical protein
MAVAFVPTSFSLDETVRIFMVQRLVFAEVKSWLG